MQCIIKLPRHKCNITNSVKTYYNIFLAETVRTLVRRQTETSATVIFLWRQLQFDNN